MLSGFFVGFFFSPLAVSCSFSCRSTLQNKVGADGPKSQARKEDNRD